MSRLGDESASYRDRSCLWIPGILMSDLSKSRVWVREQSQFEVPFFGPGAGVADGPSRRAFSGPCH